MTTTTPTMKTKTQATSERPKTSSRTLTDRSDVDVRGKKPVEIHTSGDLFFVYVLCALSYSNTETTTDCVHVILLGVYTQTHSNDEASQYNLLHTQTRGKYPNTQHAQRRMAATLNPLAIEWLGDWCLDSNTSSSRNIYANTQIAEPFPPFQPTLVYSHMESAQ